MRSMGSELLVPRTSTLTPPRGTLVAMIYAPAGSIGHREVIRQPFTSPVLANAVVAST